MLFALIAIAMTSCGDKDSEGLSKIIEYPRITLKGDVFYVSTLGQAYEEPGYSATYNGQDYTSNITVTQAIDVNTAGLYPVVYSATSPDGYTWSETRTVAVCDPTITTDLSGAWTVDGGNSFRNMNNAEVAHGGAFTVRFTKLAPGIFRVSDMFGGWYDQRAAYGARYACVGEVQLTADNKIIGLSSSVAGWGDSLDSFYNGVYDPETNTISWDCDYAGQMTFHIVIKK